MFLLYRFFWVAVKHVMFGPEVACSDSFVGSINGRKRLEMLSPEPAHRGIGYGGPNAICMYL